MAENGYSLVGWIRMDSKLLWESRYLLVKLEKLLEVVERDLTEFRAVHISKGQRQYSVSVCSAIQTKDVHLFSAVSCIREQRTWD